MITDYSAKIKQLKDDGYTFSIQHVLNRSFELFKRAPGLYIAFLIIFLAVGIILGLLPMHESISNLINSHIISPILITGCLLFTYKLNAGQDISMRDFFGTLGRFREYGLAYFISRLFAALPILVLMLFFMQQSGFFVNFIFEGNVAFDAIDIDQFGPVFVLTMILAFCVALYFLVAYALVLPFFLFNDRDNSIIESLEDLRKITTKKLFKFIGFFIVLMLLNLLGMLLLVIGLLVTIPVSIISIFVLFDEIFGTDANGENRDLEFDELKWDS